MKIELTGEQIRTTNDAEGMFGLYKQNRIAFWRRQFCVVNKNSPFKQKNYEEKMERIRGTGNSDTIEHSKHKRPIATGTGNS